MVLDLEPALDVLAGDGVSLTLIEMDGGVAHLALHLVDADCADCVLPTELLEPVVLDLLRPANPGLHAVHIVDPRAPLR